MCHLPSQRRVWCISGGETQCISVEVGTKIYGTIHKCRGGKEVGTNIYGTPRIYSSPVTAGRRSGVEPTSQRELLMNDRICQPFGNLEQLLRLHWFDSSISKTPTSTHQPHQVLSSWLNFNSSKNKKMAVSKFSLTWHHSDGLSRILQETALSLFRLAL